MTHTPPQRIYLDYNATAPCRPEVVATVARIMRDVPGNPSSRHGEGRAARAILEASREQVADAIGAQPLEIVFASGGTEAANLAVIGCLRGCEAPAHIVTTSIEHPAVLEACRGLALAGRVTVTEVPCDPHAVTDADAVADAVRADTALVSIMHANNEVGSIQPVAAVARRVRPRGIRMHTDAVQSLGRIPVNVDALGVDLLSASGHKLGGPKGTGFLFVRKGTALTPLLAGGEQERRRRPGTENVAAIAGLAQSLALAVSEQAGEAARLQKLRQALWEGLREELDGLTPQGGAPGNTLPNTLCVTVNDVRGDDLMMALDLDGVAVSTGSACAVGAGKASHVTTAIERAGGRPGKPLRFSLGYATTRADIDAAVAITARHVTRLRGSSRPPLGTA